MGSRRGAPWKVLHHRLVYPARGETFVNSPYQIYAHFLTQVDTGGAIPSMVCTTLPTGEVYGLRDEEITGWAARNLQAQCIRLSLI
jgi:hypothetical protein